MLSAWRLNGRLQPVWAWQLSKRPLARWPRPGGDCSSARCDCASGGAPLSAAAPVLVHHPKGVHPGAYGRERWRGRAAADGSRTGPDRRRLPSRVTAPATSNAVSQTPHMGIIGSPAPVRRTSGSVPTQPDTEAIARRPGSWSCAAACCRPWIRNEPAYVPAGTPRHAMGLVGLDLIMR